MQDFVQKSFLFEINGTISCSVRGYSMHRSTPLIMAVVCAVSAFSQTATRSDSETLQAIVAELRQLRHDLQTTSSMATRVQIALYRLQRADEAVVSGNQSVSDARTKVVDLENARHRKSQDIEQSRAVANRENSQQQFEEVVLPHLNSELELLQKQEQQARREQAEAEQHLRDEQMKREKLNDLLDRYDTALAQVGPK